MGIVKTRAEFINESIWGDLARRSGGSDVRSEDFDTETESRIMENDFVFFAEDIVLYDYENSVEGFKKFVDYDINEETHTDDYFKTTDREHHKTYGDLDVEFVEKYWKLRNYGEYIDGLVKKKEEELEKLGLKKTPGKTYDDLLNDLWENMDEKVKERITDYFYDKAEEEFYYDNNPDIYEFNTDSVDTDEEWEKLTINDCIRLYKKYANK